MPGDINKTGKSGTVDFPVTTPVYTIDALDDDLRPATPEEATIRHCYTCLRTSTR